MELEALDRAGPLRVAAALDAALDPPEPGEAATLAALEAFVRETLPPARTDALEAAGAFPEAELEALLRGPLGRALVPADQGGDLDWGTLMRVCARLAAHDLGFTLCLGGVVLGSLPVLVAGDATQRADFFGAVRAGGLAGLGLSEWAHGSDLLAGETLANPLDAGGNPTDAKAAATFRLRGLKRPINNASRAARLVVLARTGEAGDPFGASLFLVPRGTPGLRAGGPVPWSGYPGLDLDTVRLEDAPLPASALLGAPGDGFALPRRTLEISRSGVACMALGAHAATFAHGLAHARARRLYGAPIAELDAVRQLLADVFARLQLAWALGRLAARATARAALAARAWTCAAKLLAPRLLEDSIRDVGTLLGARSLFRPHPFHRLRRDAPVLAIFDGSSPLQQDELWRHALAWKDGSPPPLHHGGPFDAWAEDDAVRAMAPPGMLAGPWKAAADAVRSRARESRRAPQDVRFRLSEAAAWLHGLAALRHLAGEGPAFAHAARVAAEPVAARLAELGAPDEAAALRDADDARGSTGRALFAILNAAPWISSSEDGSP